MSVSCCVCGKLIDDKNYSYCIRCGGVVHIDWSLDDVPQECGRYWLALGVCGHACICARCDEKERSRGGDPHRTQSTRHQGGSQSDIPVDDLWHFLG